MKVFISEPTTRWSGGSCIVAARTPEEAMGVAVAAGGMFSPDWASPFEEIPNLESSHSQPTIISSTFYIE